MSYTMKSSGVDWIGNIPAHWEVKPGKSLFKKEKLPFLSNAGIVTCFRDGNVMLRSKRRQDGFTIALHEHGYQGILKGMLAIHAMDAFAGAIGISQDDGKCSPVVSVCSARTNVYLSFYTYVLINMAQIGYIQSLGKGIRERTTDFRFVDVANCHYIQPPLSEQRAIASFLDDRTSAIDSKIGALKEKEQSLAELRKSIIHDAVTKGLDPKVPMKASGVDWIGDIPAHWEVKRGQNLFKKVQHSQKDTQLLSLSYGQIVRKERSYNGLTPESYDSYQGVVPSNIILRLTDLQNDQRSIRVGQSNFSGIITSAYLVLEASENARYCYWLLHDMGDINKVLYSMGGGVRQTVKYADLARLVWPTPSKNEQRAIASFLDDRTSVIDQSIDTVKKEIEALQELRKSLIHEAVTGKMDVADFGYNY